MTLVEDRLYDARTLEQVVVLRRLAASRTAGSQMRRLIEYLLTFEYARRPNRRSGWRRTVLDTRIEPQNDLTPT